MSLDQTLESPVLNGYSNVVQETEDTLTIQERMMWKAHLDEQNFEVIDDPVMINHELFSEKYAGSEFLEITTLPQNNTSGITTVNFDPHEDIIWAGRETGHVSSYYSAIMNRYTSYKAHPKDIRQIECLEHGILSLTENTLIFHNRRGLNIFNHTSDNMIDMQCLLHYSPTSVLIGGHQERLIDFDLAVNKEKQIFDVGESGCPMLRKHHKFICAGSAYGNITLRDPASLKPVHYLETHSGSLSDFDVQGNYLITCGFGKNLNQVLSVDNFLMVYDLRQMKAINPLQTLVYPLLLKFFPTYSSRFLTVSSLGQIQVFDTIYASAHDASSSLYQVGDGVALITSLDVSTTSEYICLGDNAGIVHLMSLNGQTSNKFNRFTRDTEFDNHHRMDVTLDFEYDGTPLSVVPMVHNYVEPLVSDWPEEFTKKEHRKTPAIDKEILQTMKMQGSIGYAPNPNCRRKISH